MGTTRVAIQATAVLLLGLSLAPLVGGYAPAAGKRPPASGPAISALALPCCQPVLAARAAAPARQTHAASELARAYAASAAAMRQTGPYADWARSGRQFLAFDPLGDGRAVEVIGDLSTADRIVVLVPGVSTRLADFDRGLGGIAARAPARQARAVYAEARAVDPHAKLAVVAWLGYDPPEGLDLEAVRWGRARSGARALEQFLRELTGVRGDASITLVGQSYGALVVGLAARSAGPAVTDLIALGAPGMGADRADELGTNARVWAAQAPSDWIRRVPQLRLFGLGHGVAPANPDFGALPLPTAGVVGHDGYLAAGSATLTAVATITVSGAQDRAASEARTR